MCCHRTKLQHQPQHETISTEQSQSFYRRLSPQPIKSLPRCTSVVMLRRCSCGWRELRRLPLWRNGKSDFHNKTKRSFASLLRWTHQNTKIDIMLGFKLYWKHRLDVIHGGLYTAVYFCTEFQYFKRFHKHIYCSISFIVCLFATYTNVIVNSVTKLLSKVSESSI